jgi:pimeloyl-ACP methyl ester carboxylesterase
MTQSGPRDMQRRLIDLTTPAGIGTIAGLEFGPPNRPLDIIFLHANGFNALTYRHVFAELNPALRLLAVDLRGHGRTTLPIPDPHPGWHLYADDLVALIAALGETPRLIAGHSMGASTALLAAPRLAGVSHLILFDPVIAAPSLRAAANGQPLWDQPFAQAALRRRATFASREDAFDAYDGRGAFRTWQDAMLHDYVEDGLRDDPAGGVTLACPPAWEAANFATFGIADPAAGLQLCQAPVLIFQAAHGSTCALERVPPLARLEVLPGTSHFLPMERPGIVCKAFADAL